MRSEKSSVMSQVQERLPERVSSSRLYYYHPLLDFLSQWMTPPSSSVLKSETWMLSLTSIFPSPAWSMTKFCQLYPFNIFLSSPPLHPQDCTTSVQWAPSAVWFISVKRICDSNPFCRQCPKECEIISLKMLSPSLCCSFVLNFFPPVLSLWWPSSYSAL